MSTFKPFVDFNWPANDTNNYNNPQPPLTLFVFVSDRVVTIYMANEHGRVFSFAFTQFALILRNI